MAGEGPFGWLGAAGEGGEDADHEVTAAIVDGSAAALAMDEASAHSDLASKASDYFAKQTQLIALQAEHLHEQRAVQLSHLKLKRISERLRIASQIIIILSATLVGAYLLIMLHDAVTTRSVIVDAFDTPPALEPGGLSGKVVAGGLLDQLTRMQLATQSSATKRALANSWSGEIKVEVPETGLSFSDIDRMLKARFGNEIHIGGDLVRPAAGGLELTVRGDGVTPKTFADGGDDLHRLTVAAGEYVYGQTQPALYAVYLLTMGRNDEAVAFCKQAVLTAPADERAYLLNAWAGALASSGGSPKDGLALERAALALKPDYWTAYANAMGEARNLGDEEGAWQLGETLRKEAGGRPGKAPEIAYATWDNLTGNLLAARAAYRVDAEEHAGVGASTAAAAAVIAVLDVDLHDVEDLKLQLEVFDPKDSYAAAITHYVRGRLAEESGDKAAAQAEMEAWAAANADPAVSAGDTSYNCYLAPAEEAAGNPVRADAALEAGGHFVDCYRWRADILDGRGDWPGAQRAYAEAVAVAPDIPYAYYSWGLALMRHADLEGAAAKLEAAHQRGRNWADPLKASGDLSARQGKWRDALRKYEEAMRYAPAWAELRQAREAAKART
jgi:hypothetical protein